VANGATRFNPINALLKTNTMSDSLKKQIGGDHYRKMPIQPVEFIVANDIPFREGSAIKYICRHRRKNGKQDLEKAIHYLQMIIDSYL